MYAVPLFIAVVEYQYWLPNRPSKLGGTSRLGSCPGPCVGLYFLQLHTYDFTRTLLVIYLDGRKSYLGYIAMYHLLVLLKTTSYGYLHSCGPGPQCSQRANNSQNRLFYGWECE